MRSILLAVSAVAAIAFATCTAHADTVRTTTIKTTMPSHGAGHTKNQGKASYTSKPHGSRGHGAQGSRGHKHAA